MAVTVLKFESGSSPETVAHNEPRCAQLHSGQEAEVLQFLAQRPIHSVFISTLIRDNGLVSPYNRGIIYGHRNPMGQLDGVALIGHATIVETRTEEAVAAFAHLAKQSRQTYLIRGERKIVETFWKYYAEGPEAARLICRELLFEKAEAKPLVTPVDGLRRATTEDLDHVLAVNAFLAEEEGGVNPMQRDPVGFRQRTERRIHQGRIWIWIDQDQPIFKADIIGDTPEMIYLEGIYVHPQERLKGHGKRCLSHLSSILLTRTKSLCLTINQRKADASGFYAKLGFDFHSEYETIYLR
jgi:predicted GNAT family acetyltransferase